MIYVLCAATIAAGLVLAFYLKREGERSWARYQRRQKYGTVDEQLARIVKQFIQFQVTLADNLTPVLQKCAAEIARVSEELRAGGHL